MYWQLTIEALPSKRQRASPHLSCNGLLWLQLQPLRSTHTHAFTYAQTAVAAWTSRHSLVSLAVDPPIFCSVGEVVP